MASSSVLEAIRKFGQALTGQETGGSSIVEAIDNITDAGPGGGDSGGDSGFGGGTFDNLFKMYQLVSVDNENMLYEVLPDGSIGNEAVSPSSLIYDIYSVNKTVIIKTADRKLLFLSGAEYNSSTGGNYFHFVGMGYVSINDSNTMAFPHLQIYAKNGEWGSVSTVRYYSLTNETPK